MTELDRELRALAEEKARLSQHADAARDSALQPDFPASALASLNACFPQLSVFEKRTLIRLIVHKIVWDGMDLHIFIGGG